MSIAQRTLILVLAALGTAVAVLVIAIVGMASAAELARGGDAAAAAAALARAQGWLWWLGVPALLAVLGCTYWFWQAVVDPLKNLARTFAASLASRDFTARVDVHADGEIGAVLNTYNQLAKQLCDSFSEVQRFANHLLSISEEADAQAKNIARNSSLQSDAAANINRSVEGVAYGITQATAQTEQARTHTRLSREAAAGGTADILATVAGIQTIAKSVVNTSQTIQSLRDDCNGIASMATDIHQIADQTNLLALNAAIEAARAGEQGRGFAVVADEVRMLASRTAHSTQEISRLVQRMQESARLAVASTQATEADVEHGVAKAQNVGSAIEQINASSEQAARSVEDMVAVIHEQESASADIAKKIEQIASMSQQNSKASSVSARSLGSITEAGQAITQALKRYTFETGPARVVLRVADMHGADHPAVRALQVMSQLLEQKSAGRMQLKICAGGELGNDAEVFEKLRAGSVDMMRCNPSLLNRDVPETVLLALPFLFRSTAHMHKVVDGEPGERILGALSRAGFVGLAFYDSGARSIYTNKPVHTLADLKGLKLRVMPSDMWVAVAEAMGATPVKMGMTELVSAQKMGVIDAAENNIPTFVSYRQFEAFKYFSHTEHAMVPEIVTFSKKRWDSFTSDEQRWVREAARESVAKMREFWVASENSARQSAEQAGVQFVTGVDKAAFSQAMKPLYERLVTHAEQKQLLRAIQGL